MKPMAEYIRTVLYIPIKIIWFVFRPDILQALRYSLQPYAIQSALDDSGLDLLHGIDGIAFTRGPGL
jgi:hypothetical protein